MWLCIHGHPPKSFSIKNCHIKKELVLRTLGILRAESEEHPMLGTSRIQSRRALGMQESVMLQAVPWQLSKSSPEEPAWVFSSHLFCFRLIM